MTVETKFKAADTLQKIGIIIGSLCFICACVFVIMLYLGFEKESTTPSVYSSKILDTQQLFLLNGGLGLLGGFLLNFRRPIISAISGLVTSLGITGFTLLYSSWREEIFNFEIIIMLGIGLIPGVMLYNFLNKKFPIKSEVQS